MMFASLVSRFADSGPSVHVAPAPVTHIAGIAVTNSMLYGLLTTIIICVVLIGVARRITVKPKAGFSQFVEAGAEFIVNLVEGAFDDKARGRKYVPFFVTLFFFILMSNWLGLLPGVGEAFHVGDTPLLRPFTADLNGTLAVGIFTMIFVYISSIRESGGVLKYLRHFFVGSPLNPLYLVIGLLEMLTDLFRVLSLSLRLFLNVTIGEIVIAVFSYLGHFAAPLTSLPFTLVELFVGALQAYIFTVLSLMYLAIVANHASEHAAEHDDENLTHDPVPDTIALTPTRVNG
jgi:F-type H+-transporting ATPase subunit a